MLFYFQEGKRGELAWFGDYVISLPCTVPSEKSETYRREHDTDRRCGPPGNILQTMFH